jgi:hypothetical protein
MRNHRFRCPEPSESHMVTLIDARTEHLSSKLEIIDNFPDTSLPSRRFQPDIHM